MQCIITGVPPELSSMAMDGLTYCWGHILSRFSCYSISTEGGFCNSRGEVDAHGLTAFRTSSVSQKMSYFISREWPRAARAKKALLRRITRQRRLVRIARVHRSFQERAIGRGRTVLIVSMRNRVKSRSYFFMLKALHPSLTHLPQWCTTVGESDQLVRFVPEYDTLSRLLMLLRNDLNHGRWQRRHNGNRNVP